MFGDRRLIVIGLICFAGLAACSTNPPAPSPVGPTPAPLHGYHLTLYDPNGNVTQRYDVGANDIVRDDVMKQLYVATDFGVLRGDNDGQSWSVTQGLPRFEITHLEIQPSARVPTSASTPMAEFLMRPISPSTPTSPTKKSAPTNPPTSALSR